MVEGLWTGSGNAKGLFSDLDMVLNQEVLGPWIAPLPNSAVDTTTPSQGTMKNEETGPQDILCYDHGPLSHREPYVRLQAYLSEEVASPG
jgi:hypothetical protein